MEELKSSSFLSWEGCNRVTANTRNKPWNSMHAALIRGLIQSFLNAAFSDFSGVQSRGQKKKGKKKKKGGKKRNKSEAQTMHSSCTDFLHWAAPLQAAAFVGFSPNLHTHKENDTSIQNSISAITPRLLCETPSEAGCVSALCNREMKHSKAPLPDWLCLLIHLTARNSQDSLRKLNGLNQWSIFNVCWQRPRTNVQLY